jgi:transcription elongation factor S-II
MIVSKQKANPNKDIARLAAEIVSKWRKIVAAEQAQSKKKMPPGSSPPKNSATSSPAPTNEPKGFKGDKSKRRWDTEKVDIKRTGIPSRDNCIGLLYNGLAFMSEENSTNLIIKAMEVEQAAYDEFKGDNADYRAKLRSLFQNLKNVSNRELGPRVMSGEIPAKRFVVMTHDELKSAHRQLEDKKLEEENMKKAQVPMAEKSISDALRCGRCGQKKVSYSQAQTRSADEPMTTFCECTVCGNRWKVCPFIVLKHVYQLMILVLLSFVPGAIQQNFTSHVFLWMDFGVGVKVNMQYGLYFDDATVQRAISEGFALHLLSATYGWRWRLVQSIRGAVCSFMTDVQCPS